MNSLVFSPSKESNLTAQRIWCGNILTAKKTSFIRNCRKCTFFNQCCCLPKEREIYWGKTRTMKVQFIWTSEKKLLELFSTLWFLSYWHKYPQVQQDNINYNISIFNPFSYKCLHISEIKANSSYYITRLMISQE